MIAGKLLIFNYLRNPLPLLDFICGKSFGAMFVNSRETDG